MKKKLSLYLNVFSLTTRLDKVYMPLLVFFCIKFLYSHLAFLYVTKMNDDMIITICSILFMMKSYIKYNFIVAL